MKDDTAACVVLGFETATRQITIAGLAHGLEEAARKGKERMAEFGFDRFRSFRFDDRMGNRIIQWLSDCGMTRREARQAVRGIGHELLAVLNESRAANID